MGRRYSVSLNSIMGEYDTLYASEEYKKGLYPVFEEKTENLSGVIYKEAGGIWYQTKESAVAEEVLKAYQADLLAQTVADRRQEDPVGSLLFYRPQYVCLFTTAGLLEHGYGDASK